MRTLKTYALTVLEVIWKIAVITLLVALFHTQCYAAEDRLADHIDKVCDKQCVEPDLLRMALHHGAEETRIDPRWFLAVIQVESSFRLSAVNRKSGRSVGLSQIQVRWHKEKFFTKHYADVFENVRVGMTILADCQEKHHGNIRKALRCYNGYGPASYARKVVKIYHQLRADRITV